MTDQLDDYDFEFDEERIALRPMSPRGRAKLLHYEHGQISDRQVADYPSILNENDLLVFNDTKVLRARLDGLRYRDSAQGRVSSKVSVTLLDPQAEAGQWSAFLRPLRKVEIGEEIEFAEGFCAHLLRKADGVAILAFDADDFAENLRAYGKMPLPPYIESKRKPDRQDLVDYQPHLARVEGAVASPTASLHFDEAIMDAFRARGIAHETLTLHVGAGTFLPVKTERLDDHKMHAERGIISEGAAKRINAHRAAGGRVIAVGTTALRLLETAGRSGTLQAFDGETDIFIRPGFSFHIADGLITNFHLPKSTLLALVAGFVGYEEMKRIYAHALAGDYRFFSYGDSSLLFRQ